jgi:molecular chaperone GrpE
MSNEERDDEMDDVPAPDGSEQESTIRAVDTHSDVDLGGLSREELEAELVVARAEIERLQDQSLRRQAELVNFRRRAQKELAEAAAMGQGRLLELIVPVVDDFERAVQNQSADAETFHEGVELILRRIHKALENIGVERIEPVGEQFDPEQHEAIARHETTEVPEGQVVDVYQPGYRLRDRLIRPASVVVSFGGGNDGAAEQQQVADEQEAEAGDE